MALKLLANAGYGIFALEMFDFSDYRVSEVITGYGRLIHKQLQKTALEKYGLETIFGFTDSIKNANLETINDLILECKEKYHVVLEHKNRFINTIIFNKENRFIAWTGNSADKPILKNLDGMSGRYPKWIKQNIAWFSWMANKKLPSRELLIFDEAHLLETEIVRFREITISRRKWRKYIPDLRIDNHSYDVDGFLDKLRDTQLFLLRPPQLQSLIKLPYLSSAIYENS
jgi:hypothetical protein